MADVATRRGDGRSDLGGDLVYLADDDAGGDAVKDASVGSEWTDLRNHWERCAKEQPDHRADGEAEILDAMFQQYKKLKALGWQEIIYCPKDGSRFLSISAGSTGVFPCYYEGLWPKGFWWVEDAGDLWPAHPILWKPMT